MWRHAALHSVKMSSTVETGDKEKEAGGHNQRPEDREEDEDSKQERKKERKHKHSKHSSRHRSSSRDRKRKKHRHHDEEDDGKREKARGMLPSSGEAIERERGEKREGGRRDRSRERYSHRDSDRDRERGRSRDDRERGRSGDRLRERERDERGRERRSSRSQERRRSLGRDEERRGREKEPEKKGLTLKDIMEANPGISMAEAVQRFHAHNVAQAGDEGVSEATIALRSQFIANINASTGIVGVGGAATKPFREIYVGNLPPAVTVPQLIDFLNSAMRALGTTSPRGSVVNAWLSMDGHYAFCELSTIEECNAALSYLNLFQVQLFCYTYKLQSLRSSV